MDIRRTKIVATVGPASDKPEMLESLIRAGVDVFRLNFSHGTHDYHRQTITKIRAASEACHREVAVLQDLCGPKIRVGVMKDGGAELAAGATAIITSDEVEGDAGRFQSQYAELPHDVETGKHILLDDGKLEVEVLETNRVNEVKVRVVRGGLLKSKKGMNLPDTRLSTASVTEKDMADLRVGLSEGVDFVALSFIRRAEDMAPVRAGVKRANSSARLIAKIEMPEALEHIDAIIRAADGVMVARGDLGIELPVQKVPMIQKRLIRRANELDRYVITATQMLESMTSSSMPTRAEVTDVANAIVDGTDAVMLSGETAAGQFPVETVRMMSAIAAETELYLQDNRPQWDWQDNLSVENPFQDALGRAALQLVTDLDVKAIVVYTVSGGTAMFMSKERPFAPILAFTPETRTLRKMKLFWGVEGALASDIRSRTELRVMAMRHLTESRMVKTGDRVLLVAGSVFGQVGAADAIVVATVGDD